MTEKHERPKKRSRRWIRISIFGAILAIGGGVAVAAGGASKKAPPEGAVVSVVRGDVRVAVQEVGSIEPFRKADIKSKVAGQVARVLVDVGDHVKAGDVLVKLEPLDASHEVAQSEAQLLVTEAQREHARAQLAFREKAHATGALSDVELTTAQGDLARFTAQANRDRADRQIRQDRLSYTEIRAPFEGIVLARNVQPGEMVTPGTAALVDGRPLLVVAQMSQLLVRTELNQVDVARLKPKDEVVVQVDALPGRTFAGQVYRVAAMAQRSERRRESNLQVFPVDIIVDRAQPGADALRPGMVADISIALEAHANVLTVPLEALVREGKKAQLRKTTPQGDTETLVDVVAGLQNEKVVEVVSGIAEGDLVRVKPGGASGQMH